MKSILYQSPRIYDLALGIMHGSNLQRRYEHISEHIGENDRILDVGCGSCMLSNFVSGKYHGIDLNSKFIKRAQKKGLDVVKTDITKFGRFHEFDTCVIVDILHHISPNHPEFLKRVVTESKNRVIVCEPYVPEGRYEIVNKISKWLDYDGINDSGDWLKKNDLWNFFNEFGPDRLYELEDNIIAVYKKY